MSLFISLVLSTCLVSFWPESMFVHRQKQAYYVLVKLCIGNNYLTRNCFLVSLRNKFPVRQGLRFLFSGKGQITRCSWCML